MQEDSEGYVKGRGAQFNSPNPFDPYAYVSEHPEGLDEALIRPEKTSFYEDYPRKVINKVDSPDIGMDYSVNPYQGCEHGCIYCYARNSHTYWGFSAGLDFERRIIVKRQAPQILEKQLKSRHWKAKPIMLSGNTDCYQPVEKQLQLTRRMLEVLLTYRHPVGLITKNSLVLRDLDILTALNRLDLVHVSISLNTLDEALRRKMEPRTASVQKRLDTIAELSAAGIPVNVMVAPVIPGLNNHEIPSVIRAVAGAGASSAACVIVRLNGQIAALFQDWLKKNYPGRSGKVMHQIMACHGGSLQDSRFGTRMRGEGHIAESIQRLFKLSKKKYLNGRKMKKLRTDLFRKDCPDQLNLFE